MKFTRFIQLMQQNSQPNKENIRQQILKSYKPKWIKITAILCVAVLLFGIGGTFGYLYLKDLPKGNENHLPEHLRKISTVAAITSSAPSDKISTNSILNITTVKKETEDNVKKSLKITPAVEYDLKKTSGNTFELKFNTELEKNTIYTIKSMANNNEVYSWAFQTERRFEITSVTPSSSYVDESSTICVEFSHADVENFDQYFSIEPALAGTFEKYGKRWVFIPFGDFQNGTVYTVTISKDIATSDGQTLGTDKQFSFMSRGDSYYEYEYIDYNAKCETFTTNQVPAARIRFEGYEPEEATVSVYRLASAEDFVRIHKKYVIDGMLSASISNELYNEVLTFVTEPTIVNNTLYFNYPQTFEQGYYVSSIAFEEGVVYQIFQITNLSVYTMNSNGNSVVWVNDTSTSTPVSAVKVTADNGDSAATDEQGIAFLKDCNTSGTRYITVSGQHPYVAVVYNGGGDKYVDKSLQYYSYLNLNSTLYKAGDTVKVWGFTLSKNGVKSNKTELYCSLTDKKIKITPDSNGSFTSNFKISKSEASSNGYIDLIIDDVVVTSSYFNIADYELPKYNIEITSDKDIYIEGETITYSAYVELFDGTPADNVKLLTSDTAIVTNSRGIATFTKRADIPSDAYSNAPYYDSIEFFVAQPDGNSTYYNVGTIIYADRTILDTINDNGSELVATIKSYDNTAAEDITVRAQLHKVTYRKKKTGSEFDAITMEKIPIYEYESIDNVVSDRRYQTEEGLLSIPYSIQNDAVYYMVLRCGKNEYSYYLNGSEFSTRYEYFLEGKENYTVGQTVSLRMANEITEGKVLISAVAGDIISTNIYSPDNIQFEFTTAMCPDAFVVGAYFDGAKVYPITIKWIHENERKLSLELTTDKQSYLPGDTVTLNILAKGKDSLPVNATINVNVIDASLDALAPDYSDIYDNVHFSRAHLSMIYRTVSTYLNEPITDAYGEGGGGASANRADFEDTPYFESVTTDQNGYAQVSFKLPDSITSWIIRAKGYDTTAAAGQNEIKITATKETFLTPFVSPIIDSADEATFAFRINSNILEDDVSYTATLIKDGVTIDIQEDTSSIAQVKNINFGKLDKGTYTLVITTEYDSVSSVFEVKDTVLTEVVTQSSSPSSIAQNFESDVTVTLYDKEYTRYYTVLNRMLKNTSTRIDHKLSRALALSVLSGDGCTLSKTDRYKLSQYITETGINIYETDSYTTPLQAALITAIMGNKVNTDKITQYFEDILSGYPDTASLIASNLAYASMGKPVLSDLAIYKNSITQVDDEMKMYIALAYAYAGDYNSAKEIFDIYIKPKMRSANGISEIYASTPYETEYMTTLAVCLCSKISDSSAKGLVKSLIDSSDFSITGLAFCAFIENYIPSLNGKNTVKYTNADGKSKNISFNKTDSASVKIAKADIPKVKFKSVKGKSVMTITGEVASNELKTVYTNSDTTSVQMTASNTTLNDGDTFVLNVDIVTTEEDMPNPYAKFVLPHGIRLINADVTSENGYCLTGYNPREIEIYLTQNEISLEFECYAAIEGEYVIHSPTVVDIQTAKYASGEELSISVN